MKRASVLVALLFSGAVLAQDKVLNLYSSRHYQTDEALYSSFTRQTGISLEAIGQPVGRHVAHHDR